MYRLCHVQAPAPCPAWKMCTDRVLRSFLSSWCVRVAVHISRLRMQAIVRDPHTRYGRQQGHSRILLRIAVFAVFLTIACALLNRQAMGVRDLVSKLSGSSSRSEAQHRLPPPVPHHTRPNPGSSSSSSAVGQDSAASSGTAAANNSTPASPAAGLGQFAVIHNGALELADGTPFRFASLNAPELLDGDEFEVEDTFRTLAGFGRRVTRCYTLKVSGTSPHLGDGGHVRGWDAQGQDWIYHEPEFVKVG